MTSVGREYNFSKSKRLLNSSDFSQVFDEPAIKVYHSNFLLLARPNLSGHPRLGLIIAKKHIRLSVNRNRCKRLLRESFRNKQHILPAIDAIVLARRDSESLSNEQVLEIVDSLWNRAAKKAKKLDFQAFTAS